MTIKIPDGDGQTEIKIHGGARQGAGRKKTGLENRKASISLPPDRWEMIDKIQLHEGKTKSDVLASLLDYALEHKLLELMDADGTIKWKGDQEMEKDKALLRIREEFSKTLLLAKDKPQDDKDMIYARLMTELERTFKIPMMRDESFEKGNPEVMRVYREISDARSL